MKKFGKVLIYLGSILMIYAIVKFFPMYAGGKSWERITYSVGNPILYGIVSIIIGFIFRKIK